MGRRCQRSQSHSIPMSANPAHPIVGGIATRFRMAHHWPAASDVRCCAVVSSSHETSLLFKN
jgi:hypothetical protein